MEWRKVDGFQRYSVSNGGQVRNDATGRILRTQADRFGYLRLGLSNENGRRKKYLHRLVAEAFVPNPQNKKEVNHIDGNKLNCSASNLEWVTPHENLIHMYRVLGVKRRSLSKEEIAKLSMCASKARKKPVKCVESGKIYESLKMAAVNCGITGSAITHAIRDNKTAGGYHWELVAKEENNG